MRTNLSEFIIELAEKIYNDGRNGKPLNPQETKVYKLMNIDERKVKKEYQKPFLEDRFDDEKYYVEEDYSDKDDDKDYTEEILEETQKRVDENYLGGEIIFTNLNYYYLSRSIEYDDFTKTDDQIDLRRGYLPRSLFEEDIVSDKFIWFIEQSQWLFEDNDEWDLEEGDPEPTPEKVYETLMKIVDLVHVYYIDKYDAYGLSGPRNTKGVILAEYELTNNLDKFMKDND